MFRTRARRIALTLAYVGSLALLCVADIVLTAQGSALAQEVTPDLLRALQQRNPDDPLGADQGVKPTIQNYAPANPGTPEAQSPIEFAYSERAGRVLAQFGYNIFGRPSSVAVPQSGAIQDSYVLGVGDEVVVVFRGQENATYRQAVNRDGQVILPKLNPIRAAGRSLGDFRHDLELQVAKAFISTNVFVTVGTIHQLSILVSGAVAVPGVRIVSALASPIDVLLLSGGVLKTGSLRNIRLIRAGASYTIDLYSVLTQHGLGVLRNLQDGDRILVPPLGPTLAIAGGVKRPGIYELPAAARGMSATALIALAGGTEIAGAYNLSKSRLERDGTTTLIPFSQGGLVASGEILFVDVSHAATRDRVMLLGSVMLPGYRPLSVVRTAGGLLGQGTGDLGPTAYTYFALIARRDPASNTITLLPFSAKNAIAGTGDVPLQSNDRVYILEYLESRALTNIVLKNNQQNGLPTAPTDIGTDNGDNNNNNNNNNTPAPQPGDATPMPSQSLPNPDNTPANPNRPFDATVPPATPANGVNTNVGNRGDLRLGAGVGADNNTEAAALAAAQAIARRNNGTAGRDRTPGRSDKDIADSIAQKLGVPTQALISAATDNIVWVLDEVHVPGPFLAAPGTTLGDMIVASGGASQTADLSAVEVTSTIIDQKSGVSRTARTVYNASDHGLDRIIANPLDVIRLHGVYSDREGGRVTLAGQLRYPGVYDITRNEHLSSVLERAGGLTEVAYPYGAIFTRRQAAIVEREGNQRAARSIESQLALIAAKPTQNGDTSQGNLTFLSSVVARLRDAPVLGRVTITADPTVLATKPELDVVLEAGDTLFIPKRPSSVNVTGEVSNPGSFQYVSSASFDAYLQLAGGPTQSADAGRAFVVFPDGSATPVESNWLAFGSGGRIPPGSTIVVPRDLRPFDWTQFVKDATQIISQLAVTGASLAVLGKN